MGSFTQKILGKMRGVKVGSLPEFQTDVDAGTFFDSLIASMRKQLMDMGRWSEASGEINPFGAEPCAQALMLAVAEEISELKQRVDELEGQVEENSMAIGGPEILPNDDQAVLPGTD